jgi:predicted enzyme related to lactoylglutathione lyase
MPATIRPIIVTNDLDRLLAFYTGEPGRMLLSIEVPDVDALLPTVEDLGGESTSGANDMPWGQRVAHIKDPDGNVVNLTQTL